MTQDGEHRQVKADVAVAGIRLEDGGQGDEAPGQEEGSITQPHSQGQHVDEAVELEGPDEEQPEVLKHLGEKVPEQANVGRQFGGA